MKKILCGLMMLFFKFVFKIYRSCQMMKFMMFRIIFKQFKIFNFVIRMIVVNVMNNFFRLKVSIEKFLHHQTMLKNITQMIRKGMIFAIHQNISFATTIDSTAFPRRTIFSRKLRKLFSFRPRVNSFMRFPQSFSPFLRKRWSFFSEKCKTNFSFMFFRFFSSFGQLTLPKRSTYTRTSFSTLKFRLMSFKTFITNNTLFKHSFSLFVLIIAFNIISCQSICYAAQWRHSTGESTILGSESAADIDSASYNDIVAPLDRLLSNYRLNCQIVYASASTLTVQSGAVTLSNSDGTIRLMQKNSADTTVSWSNLDTGSEAASSTYYLWAFVSTATDTDFSVCISTSSTTPSGKTYYRRLGSFYNDSSSNITNITNDEDLHIASVYDYGTSTSSYTNRAVNTIKICYGTIPSLANSGTAAITNLPFSSASSYIVTVGSSFTDHTHSGAFGGTLTKNSGSQFTLENGRGDTADYYWFAIGI